MVRQRSIGLGRSAALVVAGAEPLSPASGREQGAEGWLAWCGLPSRPLEAGALLKRGAIACPPLLRFNGACPSLPAAALPMPPRNAGTSITVTCAWERSRSAPACHLAANRVFRAPEILAGTSAAEGAEVSTKKV